MFIGQYTVNFVLLIKEQFVEYVVLTVEIQIVFCHALFEREAHDLDLSEREADM